MMPTPDSIPIVVVDGADGLTPDMLRFKGQTFSSVSEHAHAIAVPDFDPRNFNMDEWESVGLVRDDWNWATCEVERWISNEKELYAACQGRTPEEINVVVLEAKGDVPTDVDWNQIAIWFGNE